MIILFFEHIDQIETNRWRLNVVHAPNIKSSEIDIWTLIPSRGKGVGHPWNESL